MVEHSPFLEKEAEQRSSGEDRRSALRYRVALEAICTLADAAGKPPCQAQVRDLSTLGAGLLLPNRPDVGALLELNLDQASGGIVGTLLARVVYVEREHFSSWLVGCAFVTELSSDELGLFQAERVRSEAGDARRWVRFPCNVETVCYTCETAPGERRPARVVNISPGGMGLLLSCQFAQGTLLRFEMPPGLGQQGREMLVRVARVAEHDKGYWFLGCEFVRQLNDDELHALLR